MAIFTHPGTGDTVQADTPREAVQLRGRGYVEGKAKAKGKTAKADAPADPSLPSGGAVPASDAAETTPAE